LGFDKNPITEKSMQLQLNSLAGVLALAVSTATAAQTAPQSTAPGQTQATPGQSQTTPGQASEITPAQTGQTPSGQSVPSTATSADVKAGVSVYDQNGGTVGKIVSSSAKGAVIDTGTVKATIPLSSFGKSDKGLVLSMTKEEIDAAAKKKSGK
jgi:hypothetical protein